MPLHSGKHVRLQIVSEAVKKGAAAQEGMSMVEVGPRVCLQPINIFAGSFGGPILYENPTYVSPNKVWLSVKLWAAASTGPASSWIIVSGVCGGVSSRLACSLAPIIVR